MKTAWLSKLTIGARVLDASFFGRRVPLSIGWAITKCCNARCVYCGKWNDPNDDTPPEEALALCDQFIASGVRIISLTGGEPLLRNDLGAIIRRLKAGGIRVILSSNGILVPKKLDVVQLADRINISLDGPREIHDRFRGQGSFDSAVAGIRAVRETGAPVSITTVLHAANVGCVDSLPDLAESLDCTINFQPVVGNPEALSMGDETSPSPEAMQRAVRFLIDAKRGAVGHRIENSLPSLRNMLSWPKGEAVVCESRRISCRVEPDGHVHHCGHRHNQLPETDYRAHGFESAFRALPEYQCRGCWCTRRYELNLLMSLNPRLMFNMLRRF